MRLSILLVLTLMLAYIPASAQSLTAGPVQGEIIVKLKPEWRLVFSGGSLDHVGFIETTAGLGIQRIALTIPDAGQPEYERDERGRKLCDLSLVLSISYSSKADPMKVSNLLLSTGLFEYATPVWRAELMYVPDDPLKGNQYYLDSIKAYQAWEITKGDTNIVIGIVDTGIQNGLTDLEDDIKKNWADPIDGLDNDLDGYIDNFRGWDMANEDNDASSYGNHHGVYVAGPAAAETDNAFGIAGVGFNSMLLPVKIMHQPSYQLINSYEGIVYAADHGADIINCSWGRVDGAPSPFEQDVIDYATINKGALVVAAAGNWNNLLDVWPASYEYVLSVGGTLIDDTKLGVSNYGVNIDLSAPGKNIYVTADGNAFGYASGTSFAAPIVSGMAALVKEHFPSYDPIQIGEQIRVSVDTIYHYAGNAPYHYLMGSGRANLYRALTADSLPSVRFVNDSVYDLKNDHFDIGDTIFISGEFVNFLQPVSGLKITLRSLSPYVEVLDSIFDISGLGTYDTTDNHHSPFSVRVLAGAPAEQDQYLVLLIKAGDYRDHQAMRIPVERFRADFVNRALGVSVFANGRTGYSNANQTDGLGLKQGEIPLSSLMSFIVGKEDTVSDASYAAVSGSVDNDFADISLEVSVPGRLADWQAEGVYDDSSSPLPLGLHIHEETHGFRFGPEQNFLIREYTLRNDRSIVIDSLFAGVFADIDINLYGQNISSYDSASGMAVIRMKDQAWFAGISLLEGDSLICNLIRNDGGAGSVNLYDGFSAAEKYQALSTQRHQSDTSDVSMLVSTSLPDILPGDSVRIAFALIVGTSYSEMAGMASLANDIYHRKSWLGYTTDWHSVSNWSDNQVPGDTSFILIPRDPVGGNDPVLNADGQVGDILVDMMASLDISAPNVLEISGSFRNNGIQDIGSGILRMSGMEEQSLGGRSGIRVAALDIFNKGGGVHLLSDIYLDDSLSLVDGTIDLHHNNIYLGNSGELIGENDSNRLVASGLDGSYGMGSGEITANRVLAYPVAVDVAGLGLAITSSDDLGSTTVARGHNPRAGSGIRDTARSVNRYFRVLPANNHPADIGMRLFPDELNNHDSDAMMLFYRHEEMEGWVVAKGNYVDGVFLASVDSFSTLTLADSLNPLASYVVLGLRAFLDGPYDPISIKMNDDLRSGGFLPLSQPYSALPGFGHEGSETFDASLMSQTSPRALVDWVLAQLRSPLDSSILLASRAALLWDDGLVTDTSGRTGIRFDDIDPGPYYISLRHRNHLGVMTDTTLRLAYDSTFLDFSDPGILTYGSNARRVRTPVMTLWPGNANTDDAVIYSGSSNDTYAIFNLVISDPANISGLPNYVIPGYELSDINLDGSTIYSGGGNDISIIFNTVLSHPDNTSVLVNFIISEQLP